MVETVADDTPAQALAGYSNNILWLIVIALMFARAFVKTASLARASESAFRNVSESVLALAEHEGFPAHAAAVRVRFATTPKMPPKPSAWAPSNRL